MAFDPVGFGFFEEVEVAWGDGEVAFRGMNGAGAGENVIKLGAGLVYGAVFGGVAAVDESDGETEICAREIVFPDGAGGGVLFWDGGGFGDEHGGGEILIIKHQTFK